MQNVFFTWKSHTKFSLHKKTMQNFTCTWARVHQEPSTFFKQLLPSVKVLHFGKKWDLQKFFPIGWCLGVQRDCQVWSGWKNLQIIKFGHNLVATWSRNMILVSNHTKIHTSYSLKLSERPRRLTRWEPAYVIFVLRFRPKKQQFLVALPMP